MREQYDIAVDSDRVGEPKVRVCVISPGVAHAVPRTIAIAPYVDEIHFIDMLDTADRQVLEARGVRYYSMIELRGSGRPGVKLQIGRAHV